MMLFRIVASLLLVHCVVGQFFYATSTYSTDKTNCSGSVLQTVYAPLDTCLYDGTAYTIASISSGTLTVYDSCSTGCSLASCSSSSAAVGVCQSNSKIVGPTYTPGGVSGYFATQSCSGTPLDSATYTVTSLSGCFGPSQTGKYITYSYAHSNITQQVCDTSSCKSCSDLEVFPVQVCTSFPGSGLIKFFGGRYFDDLLTQYVLTKNFASSSCSTSSGGYEANYYPINQCLFNGASYSQYNLASNTLQAFTNCSKGCFFCDQINSLSTSTCSGSQRIAQVPSFIPSVNSSSLIYVQYFSDSGCNDQFKLRVDNTSVCAQSTTGYVKTTATSSAYTFDSCTDSACAQCTPSGSIPTDGSCAMFDGAYVRAASTYPLAPLPPPATTGLKPPKNSSSSSSSSTTDAVATSTSNAAINSISAILVLLAITTL